MSTDEEEEPVMDYEEAMKEISVNDLGDGECVVEKRHFLQNNFYEILSFNLSPFNHFVQEVNEIWYPGRAIVRLLRYQISLTSCTK